MTELITGPGGLRGLGRSVRLLAHVAEKRGDGGKSLTPMERQALYESGFWDHLSNRSVAAKQAREARERLAERLAQQGQSAPTSKAAPSKLSSAPAKASAASAAKPSMTAAERAAADAKRRRQVVAEEARRQAAAREAKLKREAEIRESWAKAHARVRDPYEQDEPENPQENHGWAGIHAEIRARHRN